MKEYQSEVINAALSEDIINLLKDRGLLDKITSGEINCLMCNESITLQNIGALIVNNDIIDICCDNLSCIDQIRN